MLFDDRLKEIEDFFYDEPYMEWHPWKPGHTYSMSPCAPIINVDRKPLCIWYSCDLHKHVIHVYIQTIEHHCKFMEPELHKEEIIKRLDKFRHNTSKSIDKQMKSLSQYNERYSQIMEAKRNYKEIYERLRLGLRD